MNIMADEEKRPVPMPRRYVPEPRKTEYENVTIDIIDKNFNINLENIQDKAIIDKCPNNKVFHVPDALTTETPKVTLTEVNKLHEKEDENENIPEPVKQPQITEPKTPIPAPRKPLNTENNAVSNEVYENVSSLPRPTGATSKETPVKRRAPDIPPKTYLDVVKPSRYSVGSYSSSTSEMNDSIFEISKSMKSSSSTTLNSSMEDSATGSSENSKFKSPRPGYVPPPTHPSELGDSSDPNDLLKSIGTTSKLLTESISERVAMKAKGAKHKLDKNFKTSQDLINNLSADASFRLKNVGKKINTIGNNFTLTKKDKKKAPVAEFDAERPQTVPPNDPVFKSISFSSPMNKTNGVVDLTNGCGDDDGSVDDGSYEVPRSIKVQSLNEDYPCPSYDDAMGNATTSTSFPRNSTSSKSLNLPRHSAETPASSEVSKASDDNMRSSAELSMPMPKFPPPPPPSSAYHARDEVIYGKLKPLAPPTRQKRRKNYEPIELRNVDEAPCSTRATVDSTEILIREQEEASRLESLRLKEIIRLEEAATPKPDRSDSWEYHEENEEDEGSSSPEPLYANQEATYGKLFEMESSSNDLLTPQMRKLNITPGRPTINSYRVSRQPPAVKDVLNEFDPLTLNQQSSSIAESNKSNQLLLLEHMLQEETYGRVPSAQQSADEQSICTSEEDNSNVASTSAAATAASAEACLPTSSKKVNIRKSLPPAPPSPTSKVQIIHQNPNLRCDSMENIVEECEVQPYLSTVDETTPSTTVPDLSRPSQKQTNWFVNDEKSPQARVNPFDKLQHFEGESPPTYLEAISGSDSKSSSSYSTAELKSRTAKFSKNMLSSMRTRVDALKRKTSFRSSRSMDVKVPIVMIPRPSLSPYLVRYEGPLIRFPSGVVEDILKEIQNRKAILRDKQFQTYLDHEMKNPKEMIPLENITTLQCVSNSRVTDNSTHFYCFEITTAVPKNQSSQMQMQMTNPNVIMSSGTSGNCKMSRVCHLYGVGKESERSVWMQKIMESLTNVFSTKYTYTFYRAGWCYLKNSITSEWSGTWMLLKKQKRNLYFVSEANINVEKMDLRKARCIVLKENDESIENLHVEKGPILMIDSPPYTVYMIMTSARETKIWRHIIREVAHNNGSTLDEQQLTKFDVPVLVDKCINFVYIHGSMSEGIYRKSGSENSILKLLSQFRADAFNVEITRNEFNEHDVANALKRFMRDLPVRLLGKTSESFISVTALDSTQTKIDSYKELLSRLHVIERETLKRIIGHLAFINSQKQKNKMGVNNLAMIWGPTLLQNAVEEMTYSQKEADVIVDLVNLYKHLFPFTEEEIKREQEMLVCLQKYYFAAETFTDAVKKSGDLKMWITLNNNSETTSEEKDQVNVTITPTKTAYEICQELAPKMNASTHEVTLYEVILNGNLERPLHHDTKVFDAVLSWSYWPEEDRKHNNLVLKPIDMLKDVQRAVKNLATVMPGKELKFADNKSKSLKWYHVELRDGKIVILKREKNGALTIVREIFLHSVTAYLGCEKKRDSQWTWAITFVESNKKQILRSRDSPYIGHVIAGSEWVDKTIWFSSIWYSLYGESILPPAEIIIK